jgi:cobalt-zinc-cadmium efflux system membrane fusion protein
MTAFKTFCLTFIVSAGALALPTLAAPEEAGHEHDESQMPVESDHSPDDGHQHAEGEAHEDGGHEGGENHTEEHSGSEPEEHAAEEGEHDSGGHEGHGAHEEPELVLSPELLRRFGGTIASVDGGFIRQQVSLPGEVRLNEEAVAHITPRFPSKIVKVLAKTGDKVKAGQTLAVAESSETLAKFELKSLIDGIVINRHVTLGEHLSPDDAAFVVADMSTLWADIALYPKQVPLVKEGQPVTIATSHGPDPVQTEIDYVAPLVDESTRTGLARVLGQPGANMEAGHVYPG